MRWLEWRKGPLATYGAWLLGGTIMLLALFYLIRGRIRIDGEKTGRTITRFKAIERFGHWLLAGSFVLLGITGLLTLFGRFVIIPMIGKDAFAPVAHFSKWIHNNVAWAFMLGLIMVFVMWVAHNIPNKTDVKWIAVGAVAAVPVRNADVCGHLRKAQRTRPAAAGGSRYIAYRACTA